MNEQMIDCKVLKAKLSPLQCLTNRVKAMVLQAHPNIGPGLLGPCLRCEVGRKIRAILPAESGE